MNKSKEDGGCLIFFLAKILSKFFPADSPAHLYEQTEVIHEHEKYRYHITQGLHLV